MLPIVRIDSSAANLAGGLLSVLAGTTAKYWATFVVGVTSAALTSRNAQYNFETANSECLKHEPANVDANTIALLNEQVDKCRVSSKIPLLPS